MLDNPIWAALTTEHAALALGNGLARRYPSAVSPLAGLREPTPEAFADLRAISGARAGLFTVAPVDVPDDWEVLHTRWIDQMVGEAIEPPSRSHDLVTLGAADAPEMLALATLTEPGPFLPETYRMGRYYGIRSDEGRLAAMAGERLRLDGFTELSAVCTHPDFQGRGYARTLVSALASQARSEGVVPFLHVKTENGAKVLYEKLGFSVRRRIRLTAIRAR
jgi:ribosomal protein S18 acetylase RimI-like enzyme